MTDGPSVFDPMTFIPPNAFEELGKVSVSFSFMEDELNSFVSDLIGSGMAAGQAVTFTIRNLTDRLELARTLVTLKMKNPDHRDKALSLLTAVGEINTKRNKLIHYGISRLTYNVDPDAHEIEYRKKDHRLKKTALAPFKVKELRSLAHEIGQIGDSLAKISQMHRAANGDPSRQP